MYRQILAFSLLLVASAASIANDCGTPAEAIQKRELQKAVEGTEKENVSNVEITAPGLALVSFGEKIKKQAVVTFAFDCSIKNKAANLHGNPTGFHVLAYTVRK